MKLIILFSIFGAICGAPSGGYMFQEPPAPFTTPAPPPPPPSAPPATYTKTYYAAAPVYQYTYQPIAHPTYYSAHPVVTGNLYSFQDTHGAYKFGYSTSDGQSKTENKMAGGGVTGQYSYVDPEGKRVELTYVADKDGFRASGAHLPVAPRVPDLPADLARAYEEAYQRLYKAHEEARLRPVDDGSYKPEPRPAEPPVATPMKAVYHTYVATPVYAAYPAKSAYTFPAPAPKPAEPPAPAPKPVYSSSSYSTNVGGGTIMVAAPAPAPTLPTKSGYIGKPY